MVKFNTIALLAILMALTVSCKQKEIRNSQVFNDNWLTALSDSSELPSPEKWISTDIPHNWDTYGGYRRLTHGNLHGTAWYKKSFSVEKENDKSQYFLFFEGVGSYATVWLNGDSVGFHAGGRTTFTLNITPFIDFDKENELLVRAEHPANIRDLPWVCGGCSPEWGFCEGSQPLGIFRPVTLVKTNDIRIEPFGVFVWTDSSSTEKLATLHFSIDVKNYGTTSDEIEVRTKIIDAKDHVTASVKLSTSINSSETKHLEGSFPKIKNPRLWSPSEPYLYRIQTVIKRNGKIIDKTTENYGIRWIKWDISGDSATNRFYVNGKPVFINGTAEYEHIMGGSHAFSYEQINARISQAKAMGFNSFRDGHQPHNLRYYEICDSIGMLWWPQFSAHIWFDNPEFRENFKTLLTDWVKERRNSPSLILWGLENESTLSEDFAQECTSLIRELDPTTSSQRLVTTCNGGSGTDWNVIQNWSGTYGGDPEKYGEELSRQLLNGEYGAWRSLGLHAENDSLLTKSWSEERINYLMESKIRLAESVSDKCCGQYHWLLGSHDNPGRTQSGEGIRDIDRVGPVNYKGVFTIWGEPTDLFYLYRANYAPKETEPTVYIPMHTWPDRWCEPGIKNGIDIYTNCDEVELYNGPDSMSLGRKANPGRGSHIVFDSVSVKYNLLFARGYVDGKPVASDFVVLNHLPKSSAVTSYATDAEPLTSPSREYIYRVNCGGDDYTDRNGNVWKADVRQSSDSTWGSRSWTDDYPGLPAFYGSQRYTNDPISGTNEWPIMQTFRYGRNKLGYNFPVSDGSYRIELFFIEPWYGSGGNMNCTNWRVFDVAVNGKTVIDDLDIWWLAGHDKLLKRVFDVDITGGSIDITFPQVKSGQAVISAIAISAIDHDTKVAEQSKKLITNLKADTVSIWNSKTWMSTGVAAYSNENGVIVSLPSVFYGAEWIQTPQYVDDNKSISFNVSEDAEVSICVDMSELKELPSWLKDWTVTDKKTEIETGGKISKMTVFNKKFVKNSLVELYPLSGEKQQMYLIVAQPVTSLDDPIDLRKASTWQAEDGKTWGNASKTTFADKPCVKANDENGTIGIVFKVGLASKYGLEMRIINLTNSEAPVDVEIVDASHNIIWSGEWTIPSTPEKWKTYKNDTQTTINAGTYTLKLTPKQKGPLFVDWIKVQ